MDKRISAAALAALTLATAGCSGGGGGGGDDEAGPGSIMGRVRSVDDTALGNAVVTIDGAAVEVNEQGWFFVTDREASDRVEILVAAEGHVSTQRFVAVREGRNTFADIRLFDAGFVTAVDNATGSFARAESGMDDAGISLSPGSIRNANGTEFAGIADVTVSLLDPSSREQRQGVPGGFYGIEDGGETVDFESFGMLNVSIDDGSGNALVLGSGATISFRLPVASGGTPPATVPLWNYDLAQGAWVETGVATYDEGTGVYIATAPDMSAFAAFAGGTAGTPAPSGFWNADQPYATACLEGVVVNPDNEPAVGGIEVTSEGIDYVGSSTTYTDEDGRFRVNVKASAAAQVFAQGGGLYTETPVVVDPTPSELATEGCTDIGEVVLAYPIASIVLTWGESPSDLDSHFTGPDGMGARFHVYYGNPSVPQAGLDTDDTSSFGPEVTSLFQAEPGEYVYAIHNYSGEASGPIAASGARVRAFFPDGFREFDVAEASGEVTEGEGVWRVFSFRVNADGEVTDFDSINEIVPYTDDTVYDP